MLLLSSLLAESDHLKCLIIKVDTFYFMRTDRNPPVSLSLKQPHRRDHDDSFWWRLQSLPHFKSQMYKSSLKKTKAWLNLSDINLICDVTPEDDAHGSPAAEESG